MRRKVIQIADSTQLVSLPRKWAIKYGIKKGDELEIEEKGNRIVVSSEKGTKLERVEIDVTGLDRTSLLYFVEILYRLGYDEIKVNFTESTVDHYRLQKKENIISLLNYVASRLIGMEIIEQKEKYVVLKNLEQIAPHQFETVIQRIFFLVKDISQDLVTSITNKDSSLLSTIEAKHDAIAKFISYGMRILNKTGPEEGKNAYLLFHILAQLDKVTDIIKYAARDIQESGKALSKDTVEIISDIQVSLLWYCDMFVKFEKNKVRDLYKNRHSVIEKIVGKKNKLKPEELRLVEYCRHILEFLVDVTEARMGMEY